MDREADRERKQAAALVAATVTEVAARQRLPGDALSVPLPPASFPAIDRAFALLSRRLRLPFEPMRTPPAAAPSERQQRQPPPEPAASPAADSDLTPTARPTLPPLPLPLSRPPFAPVPLSAYIAPKQPALAPMKGGGEQSEEQDSSGTGQAAAAEAEEEPSLQAEAERHGALLRCAWLHWRRHSAEERRRAELWQVRAERQHRSRVQAAAWAEWETALAARASVSLSLLALADGWRRRRLLLLVCSAWSRRCRSRRAVRLRCRQLLRALGERSLSSGFPAARVRQEDGTFAMAEGWHAQRLVAQAWRGWLQCMAC